MKIFNRKAWLLEERYDTYSLGIITTLKTYKRRDSFFFHDVQPISNASDIIVSIDFQIKN